MSSRIKTIVTENAPKPAGHYAQAVVFGELIFVSGQLPIDTQTCKIVGENIEEQTRQVLQNIESILQAAGSSRQKVLKVSIYIPDISLWDKVNWIYAQFFGDHFPARCIISCRELHFGSLIEMDVIAHT